MADDENNDAPRERYDTADSMPIIVDDDGQPVSRSTSPFTAHGNPRPRKTVQNLAEDTKSEIKQLGTEIEDLRYSLGLFRVSLVGEDGTNGRIGNLRAEIERVKVTSAAVSSALTAVDSKLHGAAATAAALDELHASIWGDAPRKQTDPPVIMEARKGKWILRALAGIAIGAVGTAGYMIRDLSQMEGTITAEIDANKDSIRALESEYQLLFLKLLPGAQPP